MKSQQAAIAATRAAFTGCGAFLIHVYRGGLQDLILQSELPGLSGWFGSVHLSAFAAPSAVSLMFTSGEQRFAVVVNKPLVREDNEPLMMHFTCGCAQIIAMFAQVCINWPVDKDEQAKRFQPDALVVGGEFFDWGD